MNKWLYFPKINYYAILPEVVDGYCQDILTVVNNTNGFHFYWEQIAGEPLLILDANAKNVTVNLLKKAGPFKLRLTLNREPKLVYETIIETVPSSAYKGLSIAQEPTISSSIAVCKIADYSLSFPDSAGVVDPTSTISASWTAPTLNVPAITSYIWQAYISGSWVNIQTFSPDQPRKINLNFDKTYRVVTTYSNSGYLSSVAGCPLKISFSGTKIVYAQEEFKGISLGAIKSQLTVSVPEFIVKEEGESFRGVSLGVPTSNFVYI